MLKNFIKKCLYNGIFIYTAILALFVPKNRAGLESLNEIITNKIFLKLYKKYKKYLIKDINEKEPKEKAKIIWFCWLQGLDNSPDLVKINYKRLLSMLPDYEIKVIDSENLLQYVELPDYILNKWKKGIISNAHFSDIVRTNVLIRFGGTWIDSTAFLTDKIPADIETAEYFVFSSYKPGCIGKRVNISNWFISACKNSVVLLKVQELLFLYWKKHNYACDYFFYHMFTEMVLDLYPDQRKKMPKYSNENPHYMFYSLSEEYSAELFDGLKARSFIHKLSNKVDASDYSSSSLYVHVLKDSCN